MIADLKPYPAMKDSGVPWLETIPEHWQVRRLRYLVDGKLTYGANAAADYTNRDWPRYLRITDFASDGRLKADTFRSLPPEFANDYLVEEGDILLARSGATVGKSFLVTDRAGKSCYAGYLIRVRPSAAVVTPKYLFAFAQSAAFAGWKDSTFIIATIQNIGADKYGDLPVPLPPLAEQAAIVRFLDYADRRIRRYIRVKQKMIKLLEEQKQAIILRAVTRGLDPSVRLKPSGVEWLGDVPEHWEVRRLKSLARIRYGLGQPPRESKSGLPLIRATNIDHGRIIEKDLVRVERDDVPKTRNAFLQEGETIVVRSGAYTADSAIIPREYAGAVAGYDMVVTPAKARPAFLALTLLASYVREDQLVVASMRSAQPHLNAEELGVALIMVPPDDEQDTIVEYVARSNLQLDATIEKADNQIRLLKEYRTRLIVDMVTGKLDGREAAARLPEEIEEPEPLDESEVANDVEEPAGDFDAAPEEAEA